MLDLFFSFRGCIGRLRYFLTAIGSFVILVATAGLAVASISWKQSPIAGVLALGIIMLLLGVGGVWSSLSLQARRIRDIGLDPVLIIPAHLILTVVLDLTMAKSGHLVSPVATAFQSAYTCILLFWPGQRDRTPDIDAIFGGEPAPREASTSAAPALAASTARGLPPPRRGQAARSRRSGAAASPKSLADMARQAALPKSGAMG